MRSRLTKLEAVALVVLVALLVTFSIRQQRQLQAMQLEQKKAEYAERIRTTQMILETEMLRSAYLTTADARVKKLARTYLEGQP